MSDRIVEGIWDCPYCDATAIGGLQKYCPNCGHPQDKDIKFRLGEKKHYLTEDEIEKVGTEADWCCDYCSSLNNARFKYCSNCGASRDKDSKDYFDLHSPISNNTSDNVDKSKTINSNNSLDFHNSEETTTHNNAVENSQINTGSFSNLSIVKRTLMIIMPIIAILGMIFGMILLFTPHDYNGSISSKSWERNIEIEECKTFNESSWTLPDDSRLQYTRQEVQQYDHVIDHYETKTRQVAYEVQDGYDINYIDNGNGTFTEQKTPKYKTEYKTETYEEPVYKDVPVYATKYYYEIDKWVKGRTVNTSGNENEPFWGEVNLSNKEREKSRSEEYILNIYVKDGNKDKYYSYDQEENEWNKYNIGQKVKITVRAGIVTDIEMK